MPGDIRVPGGRYQFRLHGDGVIGHAVSVARGGSVVLDKGCYYLLTAFMVRCNVSM
jgi:hypothetical protein